jgi:hypothetical protein
MAYSNWVVQFERSLCRTGEADKRACGERREDGGDRRRRLADGRKEPAGLPALGKTKRLKTECEMEKVSSP